VVELSLARGYVECKLAPVDLRDLTAAVQRCRRLLDLDADPTVPGAHLARDPLLSPLVAAAPGLRVPGAVDGARRVAGSVGRCPRASSRTVW
jgi:AraC family transcriptional regulator of adaptative response / DNA-3-methyladenine glycosylase II